MNWDSILVQETSIAGDGRFHVFYILLNPTCSQWLFLVPLKGGR